MKFTKTISRWIAKAAGQGSETYKLTDSRLMRWFSNVSSSGKSVTDESSLGVSTAWACIRILSETIGSIPWGIYRKDSSGNAEIDDGHTLSDVLTGSPNADMTHVEYRETLVLNLCQRGNAYSFIERAGSGVVTSLKPIEACNVEPKQTKEGLVYYRINDRGKPDDYPREKIWHVKGFGRSGLVGLSPIGAARESIGMALAAEEFGNLFFSQGGKPSGTVTVDKWLDPDQRAIARENLQQMLGGMDKMHKFALFEGGMKPEPWGDMSLEDMQFLLLLKFSVLQICRFYRIPPHMVADLERATFSNIEHLSQEFVMFTLMPYFTRFEASVSRWLLKPEERRTHFLRFNFEGLLRADSAGRAEFYSRMLQNGVYSRNEVRAKENMNRVAGLDGYTVQSNMAPVGKLDAMIDAQIAGKTQPPAVQPTMNDPKAAEIDAVLRALGERVVPESQSGVQVVLPEIFGKDIKYVVEHPELKALVKHVGDSEQRTDARIKALQTVVEKSEQRTDAMVRGEMAAMAEKNQQHLDELVRVTSRPRVVVYDEKGEPFGTVPVESIDAAFDKTGNPITGPIKIH